MGEVSQGLTFLGGWVGRLGGGHVGEGGLSIRVIWVVRVTGW